MLINYVTAFAVTLFFSCNQTKNTKTPPFNQAKSPNAIGTEVQLKYTDSGRLVAVLRTPTLLDFSNFDMSYREFPDGLVLDIFDKDGKKTVVKADYGISYDITGLIDLRKNVAIRMADSTDLDAPQLYWDQQNNWVFTDKPYKVAFPDGSFNDGDGFDANQDFSNFNSRINKGVRILNE